MQKSRYNIMYIKSISYAYVLKVFIAYLHSEMAYLIAEYLILTACLLFKYFIIKVIKKYSL